MNSGEMFPFEELQRQQKSSEWEFRIAVEGIVLKCRQFSITSVKQLTRYWCVFGMFLVSFWKL
jgi:hypothetical protein